MRTGWMMVGLMGLAVPAVAQQAASPPAPVITPAPAPAYGAAIKLDAANALIERAVAVARQRGFRLAIAVVDPSGELVAFARMDDTQFGSIQVAQRKAETAARFRTATIGLEQRTMAGRTPLLALPGIIPVAGGRPILAEGRVIGAIGVSGASSTEDDEVAQAAIGDRAR